MKTSLFSFELPKDRIAQHPADRRDGSRMMVVDRETGRIEHRMFEDFPDFFTGKDHLVLNETRVIHARAYGRKPTGGKVEFLFLEEVEPDVWETMIRTSRRPSPGDRITLQDESTVVEMVADLEKGRARVRLPEGVSLPEILETIGEPPLPPYIYRKQADPETRTRDRDRYQTIFAREAGAIAAPTAGLHFTDAVFRRLEALGMCKSFVLLHVGIGTFQPVTAERVEDHQMFSERYEVSEASAARIRETKEAGGRVVAVGSTSVRTLESSVDAAGQCIAGAGRTNLFIYPPYDFRTVDAMLTNFHLPESTLMMMISALAGRELILEAYRNAIEEGYRFYSYGDCMLIL